MNQYEITFIVDPVLSGDEIKSTAKTYADMLTKEGASLVATDEMGLRQLAYPINRKNSGVYFTHEFTGDNGAMIPKIELAMRRDERIMRFLTVKLGKYGAKYNADKRAGKIGKKESVANLNAGATEVKRPDDLTRIEGIGPKIAKLLVSGGISSYGDLAAAKLPALQDILNKGGSTYASHDPATWPQQADLAKAEKWDALDDLQKKLVGGKSNSEEE